MKIIGKLYSGKPNVQFDEGELEIEPLATTPALYSTKRNKSGQIGKQVVVSSLKVLFLRFAVLCYIITDNG
jgi:hypothetical protein